MGWNMSSVTLNLATFTDLRFKKLGTKVGLSTYEVISRFAEVWLHCTLFETYYVSQEDFEAIIPVPGFFQAAIDVNLLRKVRAQIYVSGTRGKIEWYAALKRNSRKGGEATRKKFKRKQIDKVGPDGLPIGQPSGGPMEIAITPTEQISPKIADTNRVFELPVSQSGSDPVKGSFDSGNEARKDEIEKIIQQVQTDNIGPDGLPVGLPNGEPNEGQLTSPSSSSSASSIVLNTVLSIAPVGRNTQEGNTPTKQGTQKTGKPGNKKEPKETSLVFEYYADQLEIKHCIQAIRYAQVNTHIKKLVDEFGFEKSIQLIDAYLDEKEDKYISRECFPIGVLYLKRQKYLALINKNYLSIANITFPDSTLNLSCGEACG